MRQKAGVPSDGLPTVWPSLTSAPDLLQFQMNFSDGCFISPTSEPSVTSASVSRRYWPSLQRGNVSVTKESIRRESSRLAGPKLFKNFEFYSQRADSVRLRTDSFLDRT
ncbi:hypothetical protein PIB30_101246 [Stylosanthes scabra]|uniref:Uncharacterized protein n=1 Tax=Stylosanthes scabra TaxID=79078 RepID=A0ABU6QXF0_9FABA|nr:hypothetical protein [Stylosanthes scabra]